MLEVKKFSATWCGPCKSLAPIINDIKSQNTNIQFTEHDVDSDYETATNFGIRSVPTVVLLKDGKEVQRLTGLSPKSVYTKAINDLMNK
jgi:thioredoxin 1